MTEKRRSILGRLGDFLTNIKLPDPEEIFANQPEYLRQIQALKTKDNAANSFVFSSSVPHGLLGWISGLLANHRKG